MKKFDCLGRAIDESADLTPEITRRDKDRLDLLPEKVQPMKAVRSADKSQGPDAEGGSGGGPAVRTRNVHGLERNTIMIVGHTNIPSTLRLHWLPPEANNIPQYVMLRRAREDRVRGADNIPHYGMLHHPREDRVRK